MSLNCHELVKKREKKKEGRVLNERTDGLLFDYKDYQG